MEYASKVAERALDFVLDVSIRHLGYIISYKGNVEELNDRVKALERERDRVEHQVDYARKNVKGIEANVGAWIEKVKENLNENTEFQNDEGHTKTGCSRGILPFLWYRHKLGRKAKKMEMDVKLLIEESKFDTVSYQQNLRSTDVILSNAGYVEFGSRKRTVDKIMEKLEDSTVRMIGVHGPGGVGKTTLVKEIDKKARDNKLFNVVVIVNITRNPSLQKIQEKIADDLELTFEGEGENGRADRLRRRLKQEKENTLVILDDLWDGLDLNKLGIPFDDDNSSHMTLKERKEFITSRSKSGIPIDDDEYLSKVSINDVKNFSFKMVKNENSPGEYKGCKILLTSRIKEVLSDKMNVMESSIFPVKELDEKEAITWFKKVADIPDGYSMFKPEIVKKYCAGLPMAILTVGRALRHKNETVWEDTLEKLKKQELMGVQKSMEISVKMSYDHLESEELKSIFLLCAQMGHQPLIMDLVKYCFGLGILKGVHSLRDAHDRICMSIQKLKDSCLMLDGNSSDHFNMHDMVREAALSIAHKDQNVFALRNDKLDDWPDKDELERCTVISIYKSDIIDELPKVINCPQLKVFHIDSDDPSLKIPDRFFEGMEKLRVLILTGIHLPRLPSSIKCLSNLRMLCLERCILDDLSGIGDLKKLRILSLSGSRIEILAAELGGLVRLQLLDISDCSIVNVIPPNFISSLTSLEELYIRKSLIKMEVDEETKQSQILVLSELKHLHQLKIIDVCIPSAEVLPSSLFFDKLNDYNIVIGDFKTLSIGDFKMPNKYEASRSLALQLKAGIDIHSLKGIKMLFKRVENLLLGELNGVRNAFYELNLDGFPYLKHLSIINNLDIEYIVNSMELSRPLNAFPNLEYLNLYKLENLKEICCSLVTDVSFSRLKTIKVKMCSQLKNLFSFYIVRFLASLETIDVSKCDSLVEIVVEERENNNKVEFHKLCSLTLHDLPSFNSFYTHNKLSAPQLIGPQASNEDQNEITNAEDEHMVTASLSLFGDLVEIPNIESLKLSSINIHKIWSDQPLSSFCCQNLIKLTLKDCHNLRYICSLSVASSLKKLKGLYVSGCPTMENIFITEGNMDYSKDCIFPKLEEIQLTYMKMLKDIWPTKVNADSFTSLISVHIEECKKLDKIFPSHMEGWFESLNSLKVVDCKSVEVIFEIGNPHKISACGVDTKLQLILLNRLRNLRQVWNRDPGGTVNFTNMRSIEVKFCPTLSKVLPASVAKGLEKLEDFSVWSCNGMEEIVAWTELSKTSNEPLTFPEVACMEFLSLQNLRCFYMGGHTVNCPKLKRLAVNMCPKLETFTTEDPNEEGKPVFSADKVISNLEYMDIGLEEAKWLQRNIGKYLMHRLKQLHLRSLPSIDMLYWFLHRIPNLERLDLTSPGDDIKELVPRANIAPQERLGTVFQLKELNLLGSAIEDIGFERDAVLQRVERLVLHYCFSLINLAPSSVSFTHLTYLEVNYCPRITNLMASSTAESLVQLTTMKVIKCEVKEIVTNEGNEEEREINIVFGKLITIELVTLANLSSFCSNKNCKFLFPSLEKLIVRDCPKLKTFTESHTRAPKLQNVLAVEGEEEEKWYWEGDLNATMKKVFADKIAEFTSHKKYLSLAENPRFQDIWLGSIPIPDACFSNLEFMDVDRCEFLSSILPFHLVPSLNKLERLEVRNCSSVKTIFDMKCRTEHTKMTMGESLPFPFSLKSLILWNLPNLESVWNDDSDGVLSVQLLQEVRVDECKCLTSLFPISVAKDLVKLETLEVEHCEGLMEIVSGIDESPTGTHPAVEFPCLTSLMLLDLPKLKCFFCSLHSVEFKMFSRQDQHIEDQVCIEKATPNLHLSLGGKELKMIWHGQCHGNLLHKIKVLDLLEYDFEQDVFPYEFLQKFPNIENLVVSKSSFMEIFCSERPNVDYNGSLPQLKVLKLDSLSELISIGLEHSWVQPFLNNLETLEASNCYRLTNLVPSAVCFSNLMHLTVTGCSDMIHLFTFSTARSLAQLKQMDISHCNSIQVIVSNEGNESHQDEIIFGQLQMLNLESLPNLIRFYNGSFSLSFPSLEQLSVIYCGWMDTFCQGTINANKLSAIKIGQYQDAIPLNVDLNFTIRKMFEEKVAKFAMNTTYLNLGDNLNPGLREIWRGSFPVPFRCFINLKHLIMQRCEFLSIVIPSHILGLVCNLEELEVRQCNSVKAIFEVKDIAQGTNKLNTGPTLAPTFRLKKLMLDRLPNLESVFPASMVQSLVKLKKLDVQQCGRLVEIVAKDEATTEGTPEFVLACMTSITLRLLPVLKCFYPGLYKLECPKLKEIHLFHCEKLSTFRCESHNFPEAQPENRLGVSSYPHALFMAEKVIPYLEFLTLSKEEIMMIWPGKFHANFLHNLQALQLQCFHSVLDTFPYGLIHEAPNIEKLCVNCSSFKEIFCSKRPSTNFTEEILSHLKCLQLSSLSELNSIGLENSWMGPISENLEKLQIVQCHSLRNLVPPSVSFSSLVDLKVSECHGLLYLFTSSSARSLRQLKKMKVEKCESLQEIIFEEVDEMTFELLDTLSFHTLPKLGRFCKGSISFPSLEQLSVTDCRGMETFCLGTACATKLSAVDFKEDRYSYPVEVDLNFTIRKVFEAMAEFVPNSNAIVKIQEEEIDSTDS